MITSEEIKRRLWDGANELRGSMDASRYKDYMLGLMFYKFLSDKTLEQFRISFDESINNDDEELVAMYENAGEEYGNDLFDMLQSHLGYYVKPEYLYQRWLKDIKSGDFEVQKVIDSLNNFELSISKTGDSDDFKGLFTNSTLDLTDTALGSNLRDRSNNIQSLILLFADLNMVALQKGDVLGDAYEYLIGQFAMESGKKAGEFYTPRQVSEVMAQIIAKTSDIKSIYDPTVGSGSLLLTVKKHLTVDKQKTLNYYGQEKNTATYNLTRMNLLLHGVRPEKMTIRNADTLAQDWPEDPKRPNEGVQFDAVVMNPPYSLKNWNRANLKISDPRFEDAGVLPPDSKGDYAFLLHGLFHLGQNGAMAIVLPHGVLFRGSAEGKIRERLLEKNNIDTIIGLPSNLFTNTGIPVIVMILKKNRNIGEPVLIIDASKDFIKVGKQNALQEKDIAKIVDTYENRREIKGYSHLASREEIIKNEYNMNIPRYIDAVDKDVSHDVDGHLYGGIPLSNIQDLTVLQKLVPNTLSKSLETIRPGYVKLTMSIDDLTNEILNSDVIKSTIDSLQTKIQLYVDQYLKILKTVDKNVNLTDLMDEMLLTIKQLLVEYEYIDIYDGYQVIAEIWKESLAHDLEIIALSDFYDAGRTRVPNMVTKGTGNKKREEQDGWLGSIVPNNLVADILFKNDVEKIESYKSNILDVDAKLSDLLESAKSEDDLLTDILNEAQDGFDSKLIKAMLKSIDKSELKYKKIKEVDNLFSNKSSTNKKIKEAEKKLKEDVQTKLEHLTNEEIDTIMDIKWFGNIKNSMVTLATSPIKKEINQLKLLNERYSDTLASIDEEIAELEASLQLLMNDLVVTK